MARTIAKDHDRKRGQILRAAAKVFATEGFDRASMAQLAHECGISKANIYHYYDSKHALLFDLLDNYLKTLRDRICGLDLTGLSPEDRLRRTICEILLAYQGADHEHQVQIGSMPALPEEEQNRLRGYQRDLVGHVGAILRDNAPGVLAADAARLRAATMSVFGMLNWFYMWKPGADCQARENYAGLVSNLVLKGLGGI